MSSLENRIDTPIHPNRADLVNARPPPMEVSSHDEANHRPVSFELAWGLSLIVLIILLVVAGFAGLLLVLSRLTGA